jgi:hypothetical protein
MITLKDWNFVEATWLSVGDIVTHRSAVHRLIAPSLWLVIDAWTQEENFGMGQYVEMLSLDSNRIVLNPTDVLMVVVC